METRFLATQMRMYRAFIRPNAVEKIYNSRAWVMRNNADVMSIATRTTLSKKFTARENSRADVTARTRILAKKKHA
jgi:hypothetical protein